MLCIQDNKKKQRNEVEVIIDDLIHHHKANTGELQVLDFTFQNTQPSAAERFHSAR
jgi:hypothetical protein